MAISVLGPIVQQRLCVSQLPHARRLLYGTMHVRAYDLLTGDSTPPPYQAGRTRGQSVQGAVSPARMVTDTVLTAPTSTSVLFPTHSGNIHAFTAITPCAVLDVLTPPYAPRESRDCTYYGEHLPAEVHEVGRQLQRRDGVQANEPLVVGLQAIDCPDDFHVLRGKYTGKRIAL